MKRDQQLLTPGQLAVLVATFLVPSTRLCAEKLNAAQPGSGVAAIYEMAEAGEQMAACATFLRQLREGARDPWIYRGAALCAGLVVETRGDVLATLGDLSQDDPLVLYAHGYFNYLIRELGVSETFLRRAVEQEPGFALAWKALGMVARDRGNALASVQFLQKALKLSPGLERAGDQLELSRLFANSAERLMVLFTELPEYWDRLPEPRIPISRRSAEEVYESASEGDRRRARDFIFTLASMPLDRRGALISELLEKQQLDELYLWMSLHLAQQEFVHSQIDQSASILEAGLQLAMVLGRRDVILSTVGGAVSVVLLRVSPERVGQALGPWMTIPANEEWLRGLAEVGCAYADVLVLVGKLEEGLSTYDFVDQSYHSADDSLGKAKCLRGRANALFRLGESEEAITSYQDARRLFSQIGDKVGQGNTWDGEADVLHLLGQSEKALAAYRTARMLFEEVGDKIGQGNTWNGEGDVLSYLGDREGALLAYRSAFLFFQSVGDGLGQGTALGGQAATFLLLGRIEEGLTAYREARRFFEASADRLSQGITWDGEAEALLTLGENEQALVAYRAARQLFDATNSKNNSGYTWEGEARTLLLMGMTEEALAASQTARLQFEGAGSQQGQAKAALAEADSYYQMAEYEPALISFRDAGRLSKAAGDRIGLGNALLGEGKTLARLGADDEALAVMTNASEIFDRMSATPNQMATLRLRAGIHRRLANFAQVRILAKKTIDLHLQYRQGFVAEEHRTNLDENLASAYSMLVSLLSRETGSLDEALAYAEEARSRVLLDLLISGGIGGSEAPGDLLREREAIHAELARMSAELEISHDPFQRGRLLTRRSALDADLQHNLYRRISEEGLKQKFGEPLDADQIRLLARDIGPIVLYHVNENELIIFLVLVSGEVILDHVEISRSALREVVEELTFRVSNPSFERSALADSQHLWRLLFGHLARYLEAGGPLTIVPHGPLHGLPFEALVEPTSGRRLFEQWDVSVTPSLSSLDVARRERHRPPAPDDTLIVYAVGRGHGFTQVDVRSLIENFSNSLQTPPMPWSLSYSVYEQTSAAARHILIASRGVHLQGSRRGTYLEVEPTPEIHDERLTAAEISAIALSAELVTLAACETDRGDALLSDERLTLTRAFLIAGAAAVLTTRWRVPDDHRTTRFLVDFYSAYRNKAQGHGMRKDEALTLARRQAIDRGDPAEVWAAWVLVGDAR